jgi:hypothetical protein
LATAAVVALLAMSALAVTPASAITNGTSDDGNHPWVGLYTAHAPDGDYLWRCTATLLSPWVMVTAGHCTDGADNAVIFFDQGPIIPDPDFTIATRSCVGIAGYPCVGDVTGTPVTSPDFDENAFYLNDLGLVLLDEPVYADTYAELPDAGILSTMKPGPRSWFTTIGYGLQKSFPDSAAWKNVGVRERLVAYPQLKSIDGPNTGDFSMWVTANASGGGTCFGDSGGPSFIGSTDVIAGVTSYGYTDTCKGPDGIYRLDNEDDLDWIAGYLE